MQVFVVGSFVVACSVLVARLPRAGESLDAADFVVEPGGKGFNLAVVAHRLGAHVDGAFAIGDDPFSDIARSAFQRAGLSADMLVHRTGSTGAGVGFVDGDGENCLAVSLGANRLLCAKDIARVAHVVDGAALVMATFESPDAPILAAFTRARARGATTLLNPSPSRPIDPRILAATSILIVNRVEGCDLGLDEAIASGAGATPSIERLLEAGPELVVVTLGEAGALAFREGAPPIHQKAAKVTVIDTIGAGDGFAGSLGVGLLQGLTLEEALRRAAACGALTTTRFGAFDAFPTAAELDAFLATGHRA
ncbi:ribokinase [Methylobacterium sp. BTF04]|uniref:ribokinase n=1 Tax=Methylobacterium sp. BTF04 TaxID=2708300 RepID=UPI0013D2A35F|nr:ribokinase [Methylobacterium sp. BTF04]NEU14180.1 ribokinase [Methylobacterium sp. BTF04]